MSAPYWTSADGNLVIYHGDARDVLPQLDLSGVDLVLTDPPYGIEGGRGNANRKRGKGNYLATEWTDTPEYVRDVCVGVVAQCIERVGRVIVSSGVANLWEYPKPRDMGCFYAEAAPGRTPWGFAAVNPILYYGNDPRAGQGRWPHSRKFGHGQHTDFNWHSCPKPLGDWQWLLCKGSLEGETVLDPFAGAFTTLLAAQRTGRKAIGIEIEEYYCERGAERLQQAPMPLGVTSPVVIAPPMELGV